MRFFFRWCKTGGERKQVHYTITHPDYVIEDELSDEHDIQLIRLVTPADHTKPARVRGCVVVYSSLARTPTPPMPPRATIQLLRPDEDEAMEKPGRLHTVAGWGASCAGVLRWWFFLVGAFSWLHGSRHGWPLPLIAGSSSEHGDIMPTMRHVKGQGKARSVVFSLPPLTPPLKTAQFPSSPTKCVAISRTMEASRSRAPSSRACSVQVTNQFRFVRTIGAL